MSRRELIRWGAALVAVTMLVAGCGNDRSTDDTTTASEAREDTYESIVGEIHTDMNSAMSAAFASRELDAPLIRAARTTADDSVEQMEAATPPEQYRAAHAEYTAGLETFAAILADVERQVDEPDAARRHLGDKRFTTGVAHLEQATELYDEAGLDLDASSASG